MPVPLAKCAKSRTSGACDYWVPDPGFIVEFDEGQHFTRPRKLALSVYAPAHPLGFSAKRWMELCEHHDARDNDPRYRDEQRAWYDTLRDLVPSIQGLQPTVRLYARDRVWCSLDPDSREDREHFLKLMHERLAPFSRMTMETRIPAARSESTLRAALVFPQVAQRSSNGVPPSGPGAPQPDVPTAGSFAGEAIDFVLFPEGYVSASDPERTRALKRLASDLDAPLLVGAIDRTVDSTARAWQVLLRFDPDGSRSRVYAKHSSRWASVRCARRANERRRLLFSQPRSTPRASVAKMCSSLSTSVRNDRGDDNPGDAFKSWRAEVGLSPATSRSASSRVSIEGGMAAKTREKISVRARSRCSWTIRRSVDRAGQRMSFSRRYSSQRDTRAAPCSSRNASLKTNGASL